ncbi:MAG: HAD family hydrolase [Acidobacteriales bacterium]|nr:HAD family hydrolase [Terriglobales bacterium]MCI0625071.1 HAD family hydrolase [Acidobacteriota bacterium]MCI0718470.1 HAD family hydrolase [Acidobacteriota bacterium]
MPKNIGVFIDRDGTVSEEVGYVNHLSRYHVYPWTAEAVRNFNQAGLKAIVVTNQAGVARGYFTEELVKQVHEKLLAEMARAGARFDAIYYCPHHPSVGEPPYRQSCNCRKPRTGMLERAAAEFGIELSRSFVIGDRYGDIELAHNAGARSIFVLSGYGLGEYEYQRQHWQRRPEWIGKDLLEASQWVLEAVGE